jgi:hypothetical protein
MYFRHTMDVILKYILMTRDVRMWTAFVCFTKGVFRGLVFTEKGIRISLHNIAIHEVEQEYYVDTSHDTASRNRSIMWVPFIIQLAKTGVICGYL